MDKIVGNWLMDIAKYIATALILSTAFSGKENGVAYYSVCFLLFALIVTCGLILLKNSTRKKNKKKRKK